MFIFFYRFFLGRFFCFVNRRVASVHWVDCGWIIYVIMWYCFPYPHTHIYIYIRYYTYSSQRAASRGDSPIIWFVVVEVTWAGQNNSAIKGCSFLLPGHCCVPGEILDLFDFESGGKALADWVDPELLWTVSLPNFRWFEKLPLDRWVARSSCAPKGSGRTLWQSSFWR